MNVYKEGVVDRGMRRIYGLTDRRWASHMGVPKPSSIDLKIAMEDTAIHADILNAIKDQKELFIAIIHSNTSSLPTNFTYDYTGVRSVFNLCELTGADTKVIHILLKDAFSPHISLERCLWSYTHADGLICNILTDSDRLTRMLIAGEICSISENVNHYTLRLDADACNNLARLVNKPVTFNSSDALKLGVTTELDYMPDHPNYKQSFNRGFETRIGDWFDSQLSVQSLGRLTR